MMFASIVVVGLALDVLIGWPKALFDILGHPVTWLGRLIDALDRRWNHGPRTRRLWAGAGTVCALLLITIVPGALLQGLLPAGPAGALLGGVLAWPLIAARSLDTHVREVAEPLARGDLPRARAAVAKVVGRDPDRLDAAGVGRAAIESLAENSSDAVVAPVFWGLIAGLPGILAYKAINTADSMIGHMTDRHEAFGKAAARLDDAVNLIPARLTGALIALTAGARAGRSLRVMARDAGQHRSPNAGWPEGAMAGALGIRLSGPRTYASGATNEPWLNHGARDPGPDDVVRALGAYRKSMLLLGVFLMGLLLMT